MATDRENQMLRAAYAAGITQPRELANFMAQVGHESGGLSRLEESFNYTKGIGQITANVRSALREGPEALESARIEALRGRPERLGELMYGNRRDLGNDQPGDGYLYHGRGYMQLTGKAQYSAAGEALGLDLVNRPELASQPENASRIATWYWQQKVPEEQRNSARDAGAAINGANPPNGLADRERRFEHWQRTLTPELMQNLATGRLGEAVAAPTQGHRPATANAGGSHSNFQQTMERMLPSQGKVDPHITGHYGEHRARGPHGGTDFNYEGGQTGINRQHPTVHAPISGTVTFSGGQYGTVKIRDAQGNSHEILHLDSRSVKEGDTVRAGDAIGTMGGRGPNGANQYAQHVHYQMHDANGKAVSPETWWNRGQQVDAHGRDQAQHGNGTLRQGDHGQEVRELQQHLNRLGIRDAQGRPLAEDGRFGDNTHEAVTALQKQRGLTQDGIVGRDTRAGLAAAEQAQAKPAKGPQLGEPGHPDTPLYDKMRTEADRGAEKANPPHAKLSNEAVANLTLQAKQAGIDSPDKLKEVNVANDKAFVAGTTPGFRAVVDLQQPAPPLEQTSAQLAHQSAQQQESGQREQQQETNRSMARA
ncbi:peptidoglycan-binding protein [Xanthomonas rydalmerensis]|uniref:Peptidoglycan DD-metalloendopeptidase family protein n=1 Tax=Xanthomonas rydalmerensis TaxID=3046274 RepID=A0ABZ0JLF2_9XANT|nr:peptidoglycan-binding protein [Xanthomonas sp. DM-2023]WOS40629.1 peptidoglycan DD-metalloendopeptidase family protein [Xanthomonas sp. DM-2023]WOS44813.1 peptidoglycan DD-metalloendopeptidase family protein [Xanthomonas sp. DM-2023]WOS48993.1 peptidoglycan DD-metalloendopeptidase family protein [Xanthomonas sp. DM-2023]WOS53173.1 peptidoglycan DD-metalloendopeptidase family protein [Xanthomonas sp. DM-2023]WOS57356.1 peptidoglycan DD-metalloendopeptidase family protein [Xanthomonas sp. DM-